MHYIINFLLTFIASKFLIRLHTALSLLFLLILTTLPVFVHNEFFLFILFQKFQLNFVSRRSSLIDFALLYSDLLAAILVRPSISFVFQLFFSLQVFDNVSLFYFLEYIVEFLLLLFDLTAIVDCLSYQVTRRCPYLKLPGLHE